MDKSLKDRLEDEVSRVMGLIAGCNEPDMLIKYTTVLDNLLRIKDFCLDKK